MAGRRVPEMVILGDLHHSLYPVTFASLSLFPMPELLNVTRTAQGLVANLTSSDLEGCWGEPKVNRCLILLFMWPLATAQPSSCPLTARCPLFIHHATLSSLPFPTNDSLLFPSPHFPLLHSPPPRLFPSVTFTANVSLLSASLSFTTTFSLLLHSPHFPRVRPNAHAAARPKFEWRA
jgi:hypothetical protein